MRGTLKGVKPYGNEPTVGKAMMSGYIDVKVKQD